MTTIRAIVSGGVVDGRLLDQMRATTAESMRAGANYGLGLARYRLACGTFYGHEGGVNGTASIAMSSIDGDDAVVIAFNLRDGSDPRLPALAERLLC